MGNIEHFRAHGYHGKRTMASPVLTTLDLFCSIGDERPARAHCGGASRQQSLPLLPMSDFDSARNGASAVPRIGMICRPPEFDGLLE